MATPPHPGIESKQIRQVIDALAEARAALDVPRWLAANIAVDIGFSGLTMAQATLLADQRLEGTGIDAVAQPLAGRRKKLLLADMDSTIIEQECLDELAACIGLRDEISAITAQAMRGELDFSQALRARVALLRGLDVAALEKTLARLTLTPGAACLVATLAGHGVDCHLISGGFRFFTRAIARKLGFASEQGNELLIQEGKLTGEVAAPILDKDAKLAALYRLATANALTLDETMAVGDGANDLPMLLASGMGVALHAKPLVNQQARARIRHSDLTALLYIQGYTAGELAQD